MATYGTSNAVNLQTDDILMNAHRNMVHGEDGTWSPATTTTLPTRVCSRNSLVTSFTDQSSRLRTATSATSRTNSNSDTCSAKSTESFTYSVPSVRYHFGVFIPLRGFFVNFTKTVIYFGNNCFLTLGENEKAEQLR